MEDSEQRIAAKRRRGPGTPFVKGDPRINRAGVPSESLAFGKALREAFAESLAAPSQYGEGKTRLQHIVEALVERAEAGDQKAAELIFDRIAGKPTQAIDANVSSQPDVTIMFDGPVPEWAKKSKYITGEAAPAIEGAIVAKAQPIEVEDKAAQPTSIDQPRAEPPRSDEPPLGSPEWHERQAARDKAWRRLVDSGLASE